DKIGALFVKEEGKYVGIVTESDMIRKVISYDLDPTSIPVGVIMNSPIIDIDLSASVKSATETMARKGIRHLAVSSESEIIGILSIRDLIGMISVHGLHLSGI
ncbi:MAG: CBS domain-containing protein, partial [Verrucomicrobia bacterium]|nr:CBS domain-containing protein [Verrucomicrobiota bacterium]